MKIERKKFYDELIELINNYEQIILIPHSEIDLDALASCLGMYVLLSNFNKNVVINFEEKMPELGVSRALLKIKELKLNIRFLELNDIEELDKTLLIMLDHHKKDMSQNPDIYKHFDNLVILDHHIESKKTNDILLKYIDDEASSTSEIIYDFVSYQNIVVPRYILTVMLAGITVDTNRFTLKTTAKTHDVAADLSRCGADSKEVQYLLKEDLLGYKQMQKLIFKTEIYNKIYAITVGSEKQIYDKEQLAKIADSLIQFDGVEAAFAIGKINTNIIGISARSMGNIDVEYIMKKMNGGGHKTDAACQIFNSTLKIARSDLVKILDKYRG